MNISSDKVLNPKFEEEKSLEGLIASKLDKINRSLLEESAAKFTFED